MSDKNESQTPGKPLTIAAVGTAEFTLGFEIAGIKTVINTDGINLEETMRLLHDTLDRKDLGIIIVEEEILKGLQAIDRLPLESSVKPVIVMLRSEAGESGTLRRQIVRAIGVDLFAKQNEKEADSQL